MKKKKKGTSVLLALIFLAGLSLLLYPSISNYWNAKHQTQAITSYVESVSSFVEEKYDRFYQKAVDYNAGMQNRSNAYLLPEEEKKQYQELLDITGTGIMGYIDIPSIKVSLPIYHGTSDAVLQIGVGHLDWTSLPVGGDSSHCVLSGHRGLPSSRLFTDLDRVVEGDIFMIQVLHEVLTYEVDQILIVDPEDTDALKIEHGKDFCTLVTCTPYGINTHRLLVRGHRIETVEAAATVRITADAIQVEEMVVAPILGVPILIIFLIALSVGSKRRKDRSDDLYI